MAEWEEKLNQIFQDEAAMGQIMSLAQTLSQKENDAQPLDEAVSPDGEEPPKPQGEKTAAGESIHLGAVMEMLSGLMGKQEGSAAGGASGQTEDSPLSFLNDLDPRLIQVGIKVLQEYNRTDDRKVALLTALKPFVREKRYAKMDRAIRVARLSRVIRVAMEAFRGTQNEEKKAR